MQVVFRGATVISILALGVLGARAADLTVEPIAVIEPVAVFNWAGFYAGVHAGYGWGNESDNQSDLFDQDIQAADSFDMDGFVGGVHAGYNWQTNQFVYGVEGDVDYTDMKGSQDYGYAQVFGQDYQVVDGTLGFESQWQASLRLRAGYAFDRFLVYGTGGVAIADGKLTDEGTDHYGVILEPGNLVNYASSESKTHVGWTVGVGAEYAFTANWIGRAELRYTDFGGESVDTYNGTVDVDWNQTTATAGLSYKF
jgi:outer membrane immunogenic protein